MKPVKLGTRGRSFGSLAVLALAVAAPGRAARAENVYWIGIDAGVNDRWSADGNWTDFTPPTSDDDVYFRGALATRTSSFNLSAEPNALYFIPTAGDVSTGYTINNYVEPTTGATYTLSTSLIENRTADAQRINVPVLNKLGLTIDNRTSRNDAGAIYLNRVRLRQYQGVGGFITPTLTFNAGANGIILNEIGNTSPNITSIDRGNVVLNASDGYVSSGRIVVNGTVTVNGGALSLQAGSTVDGGAAAVGGLRPAQPMTLAGGATLTVEGRPGVTSVESATVHALVRAPAGRGIFRLPANTRLTVAGLSGAFAKTGAGTVVVDGALVDTVATNGADVDVQGGTFASRGSTAFAAVNLVGNGALDVQTGRVALGRLTGSGQVNLIGGATLTYAPPAGTVSPFVVPIRGAGNVTMDGPGVANVTATHSYSGTTTVNNGTLVISSAVGGASGGPVTVNGGTLAGTGRVSGVVTVKPGGTVAPSRADAPGQFTGTLTVAGLDLTAGGTLAIELNGITQGTQVDLLAVNNGGAFGDANIAGGRLALSTLSNFFPSAGAFPPVSVLRTAGTLSGVFGSVGGVALNATQSLAVTYDAKNAYVQLARAGDATLNGSVNFDDLLVLARNYRGAGVKTWTGGDFDGSGATDFVDLLVLARNYGTGTNPAGINPAVTATDAFAATLGDAFAADWALAQALVPEPTATLTLGAALLPVLRRRRR